jgi:hypothetical protein
MAFLENLAFGIFALIHLLCENCFATMLQVRKELLLFSAEALFCIRHPAPTILKCKAI